METDIKKLHLQYQNDPMFCQFVRMMMHQMRELNLTPFEMRQAAMLAAYYFELENPKPIPVIMPEMKLP
jgi:hypothetical protein